MTVPWEGFLNALGTDQNVVIAAPPQADSMIIAFGGMRHQIGHVPPFEFFKVLGDVPIARCFLRDPDQAWYQLGVRGVTSDIPTTVELLNGIRKDNGIRRVGCAGTSAGGFAAILFGWLIGADYVHAFNPQTIIRERGRARVRSTGKLHTMKRELGPRAGILDLQALLREHPNSRTEIHVHVGTADRIDVANARRLRREAAVTVHPYAGLLHSNLTIALRDNGTLRSLLLASAQG